MKHFLGMMKYLRPKKSKLCWLFVILMNLDNLFNSTTEFEHIKAKYFSHWSTSVFLGNQPGSVMFKFRAFK